MSVITFPTALEAAVRLTWGRASSDIRSRSVFGSQTVAVAPSRWTASLAPTPKYEADAGALQAFILSLDGEVNQLAMWNLARPAPLGTMRGTMTFSGAHAQGATTLVIAATGQNGTTLKQGDWLGFGSGTTQQLVMVMADASADASGITVSIKSPLRNAFANGAAITWDKPKALFAQAQAKATWDYSAGIVSGFALDLIERWEG